MRCASASAVHPGHVHVEDREIEGTAHENLQRLLGRFGVLNRHAPFGRLQRQDPAVGRIVVDDQHALALQRRLRAD